MREKAFGGSAAEDGSELSLDGGEDLVGGVRGELARRGGVGVRAAKGPAQNTHVVPLVKIIPFGTTLPQTPYPYDG